MLDSLGLDSLLLTGDERLHEVDVDRLVRRQVVADVDCQETRTGVTRVMATDEHLLVDLLLASVLGCEGACCHGGQLPTDGVVLDHNFFVSIDNSGVFLLITDGLYCEH